MKKLLLIALFVLPNVLFAQWQECSAPNQGSIIQLETFDNFIWAGTTDGGVYRTNNQQSFWQNQNVGLPSIYDKQIYSMKVINGALYIGCRGGLYKKSSANGNWVQQLDLYYPASDVVGAGGNILLAGMYGIIKRSTDGGITWNDANTGLPTGGNFDIRTMVSNPITNEVIINVDGAGLYHSINQGLSWSQINYPGSFSPLSAFISMLKFVDNIVYAGVEPQGLYSLNSTTGSWQLIAQTGGRISDMIIVNNNYLVTASYGIQSFPQFGSGMFTTVVANNPSYLSGSFSIEQSGNQIYIGGMNECALLIDTALQAYSIKKEGMKASPTEWISGDGINVFAHADKQHFTHSSDDEFASSSIVQDLDPYILYDNIADDYLTQQKWYFVRNGRGVSLSYDHGQTAIKANNGLPASIFQTYTISSICPSNAGYVILGSRDGKFYRSVNDTSWVLLCDLNSSSERIDKIINTGNYLFAGTQSVLSASSSHVYRSADNGQTWQILPGPFQSGMSVYGLTYDGTRLIAGASGYGTFASNDFGQTWTTINTGLPQYSVFRRLKSFSGSVYAVTNNDQLLFQLAPGDTTWSCLNSTAGSPSAYELFYQNGTLFLGSVDNGIYKWPNFNTGLTSQTKIEGNLYPNPSSNCRIDITNDYALPLSIQIINAQGKVLYSESINDHRKSIFLNAPGFIPGMYLVQLRDNVGRTSVKKWLVE